MTLSKNTLGNTGISVTELCLGTLIYGRLQADLPAEEGAKAVRRAVELGITFIDTAKTYDTYKHVRKGLEGYEDADDIVIASKSPSATYKEMREDVDAALNELRRDKIDIFHLHLIRSEEQMKEREGALQALAECKREGKIRAAGMSTHGVAGTKCALAYDDIEVVFPLLNKTGIGLCDGTRDEMIAVIRELKETGRGLYAMKPLGGGHLIHDIPDAIDFMRGLNLFDSISVGLKTPEEVEAMAGIFTGSMSARKKALDMGRDRANRKSLIIYDFLCEKCGSCIDECAQDALVMGENVPVVDTEKCVLCGYCAAVCPKFAIRVI